MRRSTKIQLALFIALAIFIIPAGTRYALGAQFLSLGTIGIGDKPVTATAYFDDGRGLGPGTVVTYQGVVIGEITELGPVPPDQVQTIETADGPLPVPIKIDFKLDPGIQVPSNVTPVSTTLNVAGLVNLELRPLGGAVEGDNLQDGAVLFMDPTLQRANFRQVLVALNDVIESLDVDAVSSLLNTVGDTFRGRGDDIGDIIDNVGTIADVFEKHTDTIEWLGTNGPATMDLLADASDSLPASFSTFRTWTQQLLESWPDIQALIDTGPGGMRRVADLIAQNQDNLNGAFGSLGDILPVVSDRDAALREIVGGLPGDLNTISTINRGDRLSFSLVLTQGPVCYYDTPRRSVLDTTPHEPNRNVYCPPGPDLSQRGPTTAPRPDGLGLVRYTSPGIATGPPIASNPLIIAPLNSLLQPGGVR